eukprot:Gb_06864 [translate_table: standard]
MELETSPFSCSDNVTVSSPTAVETSLDFSSIGDAFCIEDLSEFSNEDIAAPILACTTAPFLNHSFAPCNILESTACNSFDTLNAAINTQFPPPLEDEQIGLEWLSDFTEESLAANSVSTHTNICSDEQKQETQQDSNLRSEKNCQASLALAGACSKKPSLTRAIPCRARSKRSRVRVWPTQPRNPDTRQRDTYAHNSAYDQEIEPPRGSSYDRVGEGKVTKKKKRKDVDAQPRRCTHCQSQKTPQWRLGPLGPKSLCNACGVRFKSGRLFPEYRPAKSPTFVGDMHSNSHKKVLEMRGLNHHPRRHHDLKLNVNPNSSIAV